MTDDDLTARALDEMERAAADLAALGGARITSALGRTLSIRYKSDAAAAGLARDPVSEVDHDVERLIREEVDARFDGHDVLGEESEERPGRGHAIVWAIDPIDGTTNFVNGFPLFASSVGVLHHGRPVAGAVWCSTSHALRPGVYHARLGGALRFESGAALGPDRSGVRRRLVGLGSLAAGEMAWDVRKTGSAALECAFVAAGLLDAVRFDSPNVWDVAGGIALAEAAGCAVHERAADGWRRFSGFAEAEGDLRRWRRPLAIGRPGSFDALLVS